MGRRWPLGLVTVVTVGIVVAIAVGSQGSKPPAPTSSPSTAAALPTASQTSQPASASPSITVTPSIRTPSPTPTPSPSPSPSLSPSPSPSSDPVAGTGLRWDIALESNGDKTRLFAPIAWRGGFAGLHWAPHADRKLWLSKDGRTWEAHDLPFRPARPGVSLLAFGDQLALSVEYPVPNGWRNRIWTSRDGIAWKLQGSVVVRPDTPEYQASGWIQSLGYRLAVFAYIGRNSGGGAQPAGLTPPSRQAVVFNGHGGAVADEAGMWAWTSPNGRTWTRQRIRNFTGASVVPPIEVSGGYVAFAELAHGGYLMRSDDGIDWLRVARLPRRIETAVGNVFAETRDGYVIAAHFPPAATPEETPDVTIWHATRDGTFTRLFRQPHWQAADVIVVGSTVLVTGCDEYRDPIRRRASALVSTDSGVTFTESAGWPALRAADCLGPAAVHGKTVVAYSAGERDTAPALLVAELS